MRSKEKEIVSKRQEQKVSITASLLESAQAEADKETALVQAAREYLNEKHGVDQFPLMIDMYWKLQAGMDVKPEIESHMWFAWANQALGGFGSHIPRPLRQRVARELCQATFDDLHKEENIQEIEAVIAEAKKESEQKQLPPPWAYEKGELILSLIGNEPFTSEMIGEINQVKLKVKNKETDESADVSAKVLSYQISGLLTPMQEDMGLKREVIMIVRVANGYEDKFLSSIKGKCKGFKVERIECFRSPTTQGKLMVEASAPAPDDMVNSYFETALWSSIDEQPDGDGGPPMNENYDFEDIDEETWKNGERDCALFLEKAGSLVDDLDLPQVGHDFWLTRNHHGAGFWDGDYEDDIGEKLTEVAHKFPELNMYVGDDGKVYCDGDSRPVKAAATEDLQPAEDKKAEAKSPATSDPRVYVGTYAKYNDGNIDGAWVDLNDYPDKDSFYEACKELHKDEADPEFMFQDYENFPSAFYSESGLSDQIWDWLKLDPEDRELLEVYADHVGDKEATIEQAQESFMGKFDSESDWAANFIEDTGGLSPESAAHFLHISDTDAEIMAQEDADSYVEDLDDDRLVEEAEMKDEWEAAPDEAAKAKVVDAAREKLREEMAEYKERKLKDDVVGYMVDEQGIYSIEDLAKQPWISIDYEAYARDAQISGDVSFVRKDGEVWVFHNS